jgi:hypothetical protein
MQNVNFEDREVATEEGADRNKEILAKTTSKKRVVPLLFSI